MSISKTGERSHGRNDVGEMKKKPLWVSSEVHEKLKAFCSAAGRTQLDVVNEVLSSFLEEDKEKSPGRRCSVSPMGGVWLV